MRIAWILVTLATVTGCNQESRSSHPSHEPGGVGDASTLGGPNGTGLDGGNGSSTPDDDGGVAGCGVQNFTLMKGLPPDLLIVLDRSDSMSDSLAGGASKWSQVSASLDATVQSLQGMIKWGLELFPSDDSCGVSVTVNVPVAAMNAGAITGTINATMPGGSTPTTDAIHKAAAYLAGINDGNPKFILLATDGEPNCSSGMTNPNAPCVCPSGTTTMGSQCCLTAGLCLSCSLLGMVTSTAGGPDEAGAEQAVTDAAMMGIHTFVVGIAADSSDDAVLNQLAINGKEPQAGTTKYYPVGSQADLTAAINFIAGQIISCSFPLANPPVHPEDVEVDADGVKVPRDTTHTNGWDYGGANSSVQFYGSYCANLQTGVIKGVAAIYQCGPVS